jgi:hypothetical protein
MYTSVRTYTIPDLQGTPPRSEPPHREDYHAFDQIYPYS